MFLLQVGLTPTFVFCKDLQDALMLRAADASEKFQIATEDMQGWYETYNAAMLELQRKMNSSEFMCTEPGPLDVLDDLDDQIEKVNR